MGKAILRSFLALLVVIVLAGVIAYVAGSRVQHNEVTIEINRPLDDVFAWVSETDKLARWIGVEQVEPVGDETPRVGAKSKETIQVKDKTYELQIEITELDPPRLIQVRITCADFEATSTWRLEEVPERSSAGGRPGPTKTRATNLVETRYKTFATRLFAAWAITRAAQRKLQADIQKLKELAEAEPTTQPTTGLD